MRYLIVFLVVIGCGKDPVNNEKSSITPVVSASEVSELRIPVELKDSFDAINEEFVVYVNGGEGIKNLIIELSEDETLSYENEARGLCDKSGKTPKIYLYRHDWVAGPSFDYRKRPIQKYASLYHLIGHCVFNKSHNDELMPGNYFNGVWFNYPKSMMHSEFKASMMPVDVQDSWIKDLRREYWNYYESW